MLVSTRDTSNQLHECVDIEAIKALYRQVMQLPKNGGVGKYFSADVLKAIQQRYPFLEEDDAYEGDTYLLGGLDQPFIDVSN